MTTYSVVRVRARAWAIVWRDAADPRIWWTGGRDGVRIFGPLDRIVSNGAVYTWPTKRAAQAAIDAVIG